MDEPDGWRALCLGAAVLLAALAIGHNLCDDSAGRLRFDGQYWSLSEASSSGAGRMQVCLDLQVLMLVRLTEPGRPRRWLWLERDADAQHWRDLRRAAYSHVPAASDAGDAASLSPPGGRHSSP